LNSRFFGVGLDPTVNSTPASTNTAIISTPSSELISIRQPSQMMLHSHHQPIHQQLHLQPQHLQTYQQPNHIHHMSKDFVKNESFDYYPPPSNPLSMNAQNSKMNYSIYHHQESLSSVSSSSSSGLNQTQAQAPNPNMFMNANVSNQVRLISDKKMSILFLTENMI
jgi:hypothetical protein